jgi:hypothetical protein
MRHLRITATDDNQLRVTDAETGCALDFDAWELSHRFDPATMQHMWTLTTAAGAEPVTVTYVMSPAESAWWRQCEQSVLDNPDTPDDVRERIATRLNRKGDA